MVPRVKTLTTQTYNSSINFFVILKEKEKKKCKTRGPKWTLCETHLAIETVITVRDKYAQGIGNTEMLRELQSHSHFETL